MNKILIIEELKTILKSVFMKDLVGDGKSSPTSISPIDVFNRWYSTTEYICSKDDSLIATLCLRACQAGYPCYPIGENSKYTGIKSNLKDYEVKKIVYGYKSDLNLDLTLRNLVGA